MRKYDIKNKRNIGIIIVISVIIIIMFSLVIGFFLKADRTEYQVLGGTLVFDKDKTIIKVSSSGIIKTKWNNDYYLIYNDDNYELGDTAIAYDEDTGKIYLYGRYYEIGNGDEIKVTSGETVIENSALTKFYKLADRKYLVVDKKIKSSDGLLSTTDFLMVDLDKVGNATLTNHKVSLKTFSETVIVTSNYTFDIANEILTYGSDTIDLKKIIGSSNTYTKEDLEPEEDTGNGSGVTDITDNQDGNKPNKPNNGNGTGGTGDGSGGNGTGDGGNGAGGTGDGSGGNGDGGSGSGSGDNTVLEEIKKASKNTSVVSVTSSVSSIDIDYVIYDPYNEYTSVYMEFRKDGDSNIETIYLNRNNTNYVINKGIVPNTDYIIVFKCTYVDIESGEEIKETIDEIKVTTKLPSISMKVTNTSFGKITYQITTDNSYKITSGVLTVYVNGDKYSEYEINIDGNTVDSIVIPEIVNDDIVKLTLTKVKSGDMVIKGLNTSYMFKY